MLSTTVAHEMALTVAKWMSVFQIRTCIEHIQRTYTVCAYRSNAMHLILTPRQLSLFTWVHTRDNLSHLVRDSGIFVIFVFRFPKYGSKLQNILFHYSIHLVSVQLCFWSQAMEVQGTYGFKRKETRTREYFIIERLYSSCLNISESEHGNAP